MCGGGQGSGVGARSRKARDRQTDGQESNVSNVSPVKRQEILHFGSEGERLHLSRERHTEAASEALDGKDGAPGDTRERGREGETPPRCGTEEREWNEHSCSG